MQPRVTWIAQGRYQLRLRSNETRLVHELIDQLRDQLMASTDAPIVRRLFPPAYPDDAERDAGYQVLTRDALLEQKLATLATMQASLAPGRSSTDTELDSDALTAWMQGLTSLRLALGTHLDVEEDVPELDPDDPSAPVYALYEFLGWLLTQVVDALGQDLPPPQAD